MAINKWVKEELKIKCVFGYWIINNNVYVCRWNPNQQNV